MDKVEFLVDTFKVLLSFPPTRRWAIEQINSWSVPIGVRYWAAARLQQKISEVTGHPICGVCYWVEFPDDLHFDYCREILQGSYPGEDMAEYGCDGADLTVGNAYN